MITEKMNEEANIFANTLKKEMAKPQASTFTLHPDLTVEKMHSDMTFVRSSDPRHPRNFFDHTKNNETASAFISGINDNTATYRAKYQDMQDSSGQWQVETANSLGLRNMLNTHKNEMLKTIDIEQKDTIAIQHKFEVSYFNAKEARFNFNKRPDRALAPKQIEKLESKAHSDFREFQSDKLGIEPNQKINVEKKEAIAPTSKQEPLVQKPSLPSFTDQMMAMRQKHNITEKPTLSRGR